MVNDAKLPQSRPSRAFRSKPMKTGHAPAPVRIRFQFKGLGRSRCPGFRPGTRRGRDPLNRPTIAVPAPWMRFPGGGRYPCLRNFQNHRRAGVGWNRSEGRGWQLWRMKRAAETLNKYAIGSQTPPSSDPASIYRELHRAVQRNDEHASKILEHKKVLMALATEWFSRGQLSQPDRDEIIAVVSNAPFLEWRPLLFVIPHAGVADRVQRVPRHKRAGSEPEYIVPDLKQHEFDIVELKL
jgi:hypothetical protein